MIHTVLMLQVTFGVVIRGTVGFPDLFVEFLNPIFNTMFIDEVVRNLTSNAHVPDFLCGGVSTSSTSAFFAVQKDVWLR